MLATSPAYSLLFHQTSANISSWGKSHPPGCLWLFQVPSHRQTEANLTLVMRFIC